MPKCYNKKMKKFTFLAFFLACNIFAAVSLPAQETDLASYLPLLQAPSRTDAQNARVLNLFASSSNPETIFAAGASLVRITPPPAQEGRLFNILIKDNNVLKKTFAAVILTAMGGMHEELAPLLQDAASSQDHAVRAYAASAYTVLNPSGSPYRDEVVNLYIYDPAFAQRAMNLLAKDEKSTLKNLKEAAKSADAQVRAAAAQWLGDLQTQDAAKQLLKMAKTEQNDQAAAAVASALAKNSQWTQPSVIKDLKTDYTKKPAATYALALGLMAGQAVEDIRQGLGSTNLNIRINSARAAAYMAALLASADAALYTQDKEFDAGLLKSLIPQLNDMVKKDSAPVKVYADGALKQMAKLM